MVNLALVPQEDSVWLRCKPWIEDMVATSDLYDMAYIERSLQCGAMHFWPGKNSMAITEFVTFPLAKVLSVFAVGGRKGLALHELLKDIEPKLQVFARLNGCKKIMGYGIRPQWRDACEAIGYAHLWTVMAKDV